MKTPRQAFDRYLGLLAVVSILVAGVVGMNRAQADVQPALQQVMPEAARIEKTGSDLYTAYAAESETPLGYVALGTASGYGGPLALAVATDLQGRITGLALVSSKESPSWLRKVLDAGYLDDLVGKIYQEPFQVGQDVDGVSGATYTSRAMAEAAMQSSRRIAGELLGLPLPAETRPKVKFGLPEITLIALFMVGYLGHQQKFKYTKQARWASMIIGMVVLGFVYTRPLALADVNRLLLGFWPQWQTHLYWYLLIGGILFVFTADNKNPYCEWFCPFGAAQECLGALGGAKVRTPVRYRESLKWAQRGLAWLAILLAVLLRNPGLTSYEIFGALFDLNGTTLQFTLLGMVLIASLFIRRPWCSYLCPLRAVMELYRAFRKWMVETWQTQVAKRATWKKSPSSSS